VENLGFMTLLNTGPALCIGARLSLPLNCGLIDMQSAPPQSFHLNSRHSLFILLSLVYLALSTWILIAQLVMLGSGQVTFSILNEHSAHAHGHI